MRPSRGNRGSLVASHNVRGVMPNYSTRRLWIYAAVVAAVVALGAGAFFVGRASSSTATATTTASASSVATSEPTDAAAAKRSTTTSRGSTTGPKTTSPATTRPGSTVKPSGLKTIKVSALPPEARTTLALIDKGGPFPYDRDGVTFNNLEKILPKQASGYYREYTVVTPGSSDRGARRIVTGKKGERFYTSDHYASFKEVIA